MSLEINLSGKTAFVTGSTRGIGLGCALKLAEAGCKIIGCARSNKDSKIVKEFLNKIKETGSQAIYFQSNLSQKEDITKLIKNINQINEPLDIVVSNAGRNIFKGINECSEEHWQQNLDLNLTSHWRLAKGLYSKLAKNRGVMIVMGSNHGFSSIKGCAPYSITKTALRGVVQSLALDWGATVRSVGLAPGFIDTPGNQDWFDSFNDPQAERERTVKMHPCGSIGTVEQVGAMVAFLASDYCNFVNGTTILMDGGRSAVLQD